MTTRQQQIQDILDNFTDAVGDFDTIQDGNTIELDKQFGEVYRQIRQLPQSYVEFISLL